jgi:hypothetical protein
MGNSLTGAVFKLQHLLTPGSWGKVRLSRHVAGIVAVFEGMFAAMSSSKQLVMEFKPIFRFQQCNGSYSCSDCGFDKQCHCMF